MSKSAEDRGHFRSQFRTKSGYKVTASFDKRPDGQWKIFSIGGVSVPTQFLPFGLSVLPGLVFTTLNEAKLAVKAA